MVRDVQKHYSRVALVLILVLVLNWGVAFVKIVFGILSRCASMAADGFHSLSDGASNVIGLVGIAISSRPKDKDHPYGHRKYETLFSLGIAALLFLLSFNLMKEGMVRLLHPVIPQADLKNFIVMIGTIIINIGVMRYEYKKGKTLQSDILVADSMHTRADIFTSFSVVGALVAIRLGYSVLDPIVTLIISLFIGYSGIGIIKNASKILCDSAAIIDVKRISDIVLGIKGVKTCHKIRTRGRPDDISLDLHVQVDRDMHIDEAHKISYAIEDAVKKEIPEVTDVLVHIEPKEKRRR